MSTNIDSSQDAINHLEDATIDWVYNSFLLNILLLGMLLSILIFGIPETSVPGIYTGIYFGTLYIYCKHARGPETA